MQFKQINKLPKKSIQKSIEEAVVSFVKDSRVENVDDKGFYQQTLNVIADSIINNGTRQFWLATHESEVITYVLTHVSIDVDNTKCFWITQAWVNPKARGHKIIKIWRDKLFEEAKKLGCKHVLVPSSRGEKAYCRFLGEGWHKYVTLLKKDL
jgi:predicted N-acetyltransferase YhbS